MSKDEYENLAPIQCNGDDLIVIDESNSISDYAVRPASRRSQAGRGVPGRSKEIPAAGIRGADKKKASRDVSRREPPLAAVQEALAYYAENRDLIALEASEERRR